MDYNIINNISIIVYFVHVLIGCILRGRACGQYGHFALLSMENMMDLFVATTPFNIMNAIRLQSQFGRKADLVITNFASANQRIYDMLKDKGIFNKVMFIDHSSEQIPKEKYSLPERIICRVKHSLLYNRYFKKIFGYNDKTIYDNIFIDVANFAQRIIVNHYRTLNKDLKVNYYEVGLESFIMADNIVDNPPYLFNSLYIDNADRYNNANIKNIVGSIDKQLLNDVFGYYDYDIKSEKNIFFDQLLGGKQDEFIKSILSIIRDNNMDCLLKMHPRRIEDISEGTIRSNKELSGYESYLLNGEISDDQMLITLHSMAVALPKLLLDAEPYIVCLYRINPEKTDSDTDIDSFFIKVQGQYRDKNKFRIVNSIEEFEDIIKERVNNG